MMEDLQIELNRLDAKGADWERLALYGIRFRCETCRYGRQKDFWFSCLRDRKEYPAGHVCDAWEGKQRKS